MRALIRIAALVCCTSIAAPAATHLISGMIRDAHTREPLPGARVRIEGTRSGTIANRQGKFLIALPEGSVALSFDLMGYTSAHRSLQLVRDTSFDVDLTINPVQLESQRVYAANAEAIIREAIAAKQRRMETVHTYRYDAYTRMTFYTGGSVSITGQSVNAEIGAGANDTSMKISTIMETYSTGYWDEQKGMREVINQRRQTANVDPQGNMAAVFLILNFNDDVQRLGKYRFVGPTAPDALDSYEYRLLDVTTLAGKRIFRLRMTPQSRRTALWDGIISIADSTWEVVEVDVRPNDAFNVPYVDSLRYRQTFQRIDSTHWMPATISIDGSVSISALFVDLRLRAEHSSVISNYALNCSIPPTVFERGRIAVDTSARRFDTAYWRDHEVLPLDPDEALAYAHIDSVVKNTPSDTSKPSLLGDVLGAPFLLFGSPFTGLDDLYRYNRVEGHRLGLGINVPWQAWLPFTTLTASAGYGFAAKRTSWDVTLGHRFSLGNTAFLAFSIDRFRTLERRDDASYYGTLLNTLDALVLKSDYFDFYTGDGWTAGATYGYGLFSVNATYRADVQGSIAKNTDVSLFGGANPFRPNDPIAPGTLRSVTLTASVARFLQDFSASAAMEIADRGALGGDFTFTRSLATVKGRVRVSSTDFLDMRLDAGTAAGALPPQRLFAADTRTPAIAEFGTMHAMRVREGFVGDRFVSVSTEMPIYNTFGLLPPIPVIAPLGIEVFAHAGTWWSNVSSQSQALSSIPLEAARLPYIEAGFGVNRLFTFLLFDFTWRITHRLASGNFAVTATLARF